MTEREITETLEKQLQLLSKRSESTDLDTQGLVELTRAMNETASYLLSRLSKVL